MQVYWEVNIIEKADPLTEKIIGAAIEVHKQLGPGLLESAYRDCLAFELNLRNMSVKREVPLPLVYKGQHLNCGYRLDLVVEKQVVLELKTVEKILPIHEAQIITYLKLSGIKKGLIINFNSKLLVDGVRRFVN